jgi:hypothetical protein
VPVDLPHVHAELRRAGVMLQLLWLEYREASSEPPSGKSYSYSQFCDLYAVYRKRVHLTMRQVQRRTGLPILLNTSLNRRRMPIVETPG